MCTLYTPVREAYKGHQSINNEYSCAFFLNIIKNNFLAMQLNLRNSVKKL